MATDVLTALPRSYGNQVKAREAEPARPLSDYQMYAKKENLQPMKADFWAHRCYINYARDPDVEKRCDKVKRAESDTSDDIVIGSRDVEAREADALLPEYYRYLPPSVTVRA